MSVRIPDHIRDLVPYKAGRSLEDIQDAPGPLRFAKLASNENPLGPSPMALAAIDRELKRSHIYPDPTAHKLREKLSEKLGIDESSVVCANGSDAILEYAVMSFSEGADEILTSEGTFIGLYVIAKKLGRTLTQVPLQNWAYDLEALGNAIGDQTKIIYLSNPNNPTGTHFTHGEFARFLKKVPRRILVILDEAYAEYAQSKDDYPKGVDWIQGNVLVLRTFSKVFGLAGLRVGYGLSTPPLIESIAKVKLPFEPSRLAQVAALHALDDQTHLQQILQLNLESKKLFRECFSSLGIDFVESMANFFMLPFGSSQDAVAFHDACVEKGLFLRHLPGFGLPQAIRINTGTLEETLFAIDVIRQITPKKGPQ